MSSETRTRRLAGQIREIVAQALESRVKDPRLGFVTVTEVRLTRDLREATIFYTVLGQDHEREATAEALESVKGLLRSAVGQQTGIKFAPTLAFVVDAVPENARVIDDLLREAVASDEAVAAAAATAEYAGDPDPYKRDEPHEDDTHEDEPHDDEPHDDEPHDDEPHDDEPHDDADRDGLGVPAGDTGERDDGPR